MTIYKSSALLIPSRRIFLTLMKAPALGFMVVGLILGMFSWVANPAQLALAQGINGIITQTTVTDFNAACTVLPGTVPTPSLTQVSISNANGGEILLTATIEDYFDGSTIDSTRWLTGTAYDWYTVAPSVSGGILTLDSAYLRSQVGFSATTPVRFFETRALQQINSNNASWPDLGFYRELPPLAYGSGPYPNDSALRIFVTRDTNTSFIRGRDGDASNPLTDIDIPTLDLTQYHNFRIEWDASQSRFYVDGVLQGTIPGVSTLNTWVFLYSQDPASFNRSPMQVDWVRAGAYPNSGTYTSCIQDAGEVVNWTTLIEEVDLPTDTSLVFDTRTSVNGVDWSLWTPVSSNTIASPSGRYLQYRAVLSTASVIQSPELQQVELRYYGPSSLTVSPNPATLDPATGQQFIAQVYDDNGQPVDNLAYSWQVVNGGGAINSTGLFTAVLNSGTYTDTVQATSGSLTGLATVIIRNLPPTADAGGPYTADETQSITLNGSNSADPNGSSLDYAWDLDEDGLFDDAATAATSYSWNEPGAYAVSLLVTDSQGLTDTDTVVVAVDNLAPTANADGPYSGSEGIAIPLSGSGSDPGGGDVEYAWDLDEDGQFDDAATAATSYTWAEPGLYTITLRVTDSASLTHTDTAQVTINNLPPVAEAGDAYAGIEGAAVSLNGFGFDAGGGDVEYAWDLDEDGQFDDAATAATSYTWAEPGLYTITLRVTDSASLTHTDTAQVTINNLPPSAEAGGPYNGNENQTVTLDGLVSADPGGGSLTYAWDFDENGQLDDATVAQPGYTWSSPGVYTVTLQVTDSQGLTDTDTAQVTINNLPPSAEAGGPYSGNEGAAINLSGSGSDPGIGAVSYAWDLDGDGQFDDALAATTSYTWNVTGTFTITLQVTDPQGAKATDTAQVTVSAAPAPPSTNIFLPLIFSGSRVSAGQPDLTPQALLIEPGSGLEATTPVELSVVIKNTGTGVAAANFWVDMYINPLPLPNEAGHLWGMLCPTPPDPPANPCADDYGLAWQVTTPLAPGQVITLTSSIGDPYLAASPHTVWPGFFNKNGLTRLWVYVDSWNGPNIPAGFIAESNETNNRLGPVEVNVTGTGVTNPGGAGLGENQPFPIRPLPQ